VLAAILVMTALFFTGNYYLLLRDDAFFQTTVGKYTNQKEEAANVRAYLLENKPLAVSFSDREIRHLSDVRGVIESSLGWFYILIVVFFALLVLLAKSSRSWHEFSKELRFVFFYSAVFTVALSLFAIFVSKNFTFFFSKFHSLFFLPGSWVFPEGSALITFFPERFFLDFFRRIILSSFLQAAAIILFIFPEMKIFTLFKRRGWLG
jgi:uncharacterized membrane protein